MTTEQIKEVDDLDESQVKLSDLDEGVVLPGEKLGKRRGKRVLLSILALLLVACGASLATSTGWRKSLLRTNVPRRRVVVASAALTSDTSGGIRSTR